MHGETFERVRPVLAYDLARYPTRLEFQDLPGGPLRAAPSPAWKRHMALAAAVVGSGCTTTTDGEGEAGPSVFSPFIDDDTGGGGFPGGGSGGGGGGSTGGGTGGGGVDTGGLDGDIGGEYWHYVSEEEAVAAIAAFLEGEGCVATGEERAMTGSAAVTASVWVGGDGGAELAVGSFESYSAMQTLWESPELASEINSCVVVQATDGCTEAWCGEAAEDLPEDAEVCGALGQLPYGDFYTWDPVDVDPAEIYGPAVSRFLEWAAAQGLL